MAQEQSINLNLLFTKLHQELQHNPYNHEVYYKIAKLYYQINDLPKAIHYYKNALNLCNDGWEIHFNLANCYVQVNDEEHAIDHYKACLAINPNHTDTIQNLGLLLVNAKNYAAAINYLQQAYDDDSENQTHFGFTEQLANCYLQLGKFAEAIKYFTKAVFLDPTKEAVQHNLAILYLKQQEYKMANHHFKIAFSLNSNNQTAKHMLNALNAINSERPPAEFIIDLFNQYANHYDQHVKQQLNYNLPSIFRNLYAQHATTKTAKNVLDLGCGTGLCGIYFRDAAINLIGVDLSREMLLQAKRHQCYDLLIEGNLYEDFGLKENYFDLIIAADLIPYFGKLDQLFTRISKILIMHQNMFIFNIELAVKPNISEFALEFNGRYVHTINYINDLADRYNFKILEIINEKIRNQLGLPVKGVIFILTR